jgi:hypothetical protein
MKFSAHILGSLITLILSSQLLAGTVFNDSNLLLPQSGASVFYKSTVNVRFFQSFGIRHFGYDLDINFQFRNRFSLGGGTGIYRNRYTIHSASDMHRLRLWNVPLYAQGNIYLYSNDDKAYYIYGKYGTFKGVKTKSITPDSNFSPNLIEGGFGFQVIGDDSHLHFEIGQYFARFQGTATSTYEAEIKYRDLQFYTIVARLGFSF